MLFLSSMLLRFRVICCLAIATSAAFCVFERSLKVRVLAEAEAAEEPAHCERGWSNEQLTVRARELGLTPDEDGDNARKVSSVFPLDVSMLAQTIRLYEQVVP